MASYEITSPEGQKFRVTAPDGASQDQVLAYARQNFGKAAGVTTNSTAAPKPVPQTYTPSGERPLIDDIPAAIAGNPATRFALGAASPVIGAVQLKANTDPIFRMTGMNKIINDRVAQLEEMKQRGMAMTGDEGFDAYGMGGAVVNPAGLAVGGAIPQAGTLLHRIIQGSNIGTGMALATPDTSNPQTLSDVLKNAGERASVGGIAGAAAVPVGALLSGGARMVGNAVRPFLPSGVEKVAGRTAIEAAGPRAERVIGALDQNRAIVPGSLGTAGEVAAPAGSAEFAALQRLVQGRMPSEYDAIARAQDAARVGAVRSVGQTPADLAAAEAARKAAADPLYAAARQGAQAVNTAPILQQVDSILAKNPGNRELVTELQNVRSGLLDANGQLRTNPQEISSVLDGMKAALAKKENTFIKGQLTQIKDRLASAIPGYQQAQQTFAQASVPVNQMQIGQELEKRLTPALADAGATPAQRAAGYSQALRDAPGTIKRATGDARYDDLAQILNPQQIRAVESVAEDLARKARADQLGREGSEALTRQIGRQFESIKVPGVLERTTMIMRTVLNRLEGKATEKTLDYLANKMRDPAEMARIMKAATAAERRYLTDAFNAQAAASVSTRTPESGAQQP